MADPYTLASCYACRCPLRQGDQRGVIPSCRLAVTGPPPRPASPVATPGRLTPLCRNCCPEPGGTSPCPWNTLRDQRPEAQFPEDLHRVVLPPPRHQQPRNRWADGQHWSPETLLPPHPSLPYARLLSGAGYSDHSGQVGRGRKGCTPSPSGGPTSLSCSPSPPANLSSSPVHPRTWSSPHCTSPMSSGGRHEGSITSGARLRVERPHQPFNLGTTVDHQDPPIPTPIPVFPATAASVPQRHRPSSSTLERPFVRLNPPPDHRDPPLLLSRPPVMDTRSALD